MDINAVLLNKCIQKYNNVVERGQDDVRYGNPPKSMIIVHSKKDKLCNSIPNINCAWQYEKGNINEISANVKFKKEPISGMYYNEAYAEFGYDASFQKAFINIYFGSRFARGFEYTIVKINNEYSICDEVTLWVS